MPILGTLAGTDCAEIVGSMARVLLLIPSRTYRTSDFMAAAGRLGVNVVVGTEHRPALTAVMDAGVLRLDFGDVEPSVRRIVELATDRPLDAIVAVDDAPALLAATASEALALPHNSVAAVAASRDKARMRQRFADAGLLTPSFRTFATDLEPSAVAGSIRYPCVIKPLDLSASQGVIRADDQQSFATGVRRAAAIVAACSHHRGATRLIVEDFIPGVEVAVEGLLRRGQLEVLAIFDKPDPLDGPFFEETIYVTPSRLSHDVQAKVVATIATATRALGLSEGPIHAELRLNDRGAWVLEVAARSIGGLCSRTLRFGSGLSLEELILRHAANLPMPGHEREGVASGVMMLSIAQAGILGEVRGQDNARRIRGIEGLVITIPRGETLVPLPEGDRYLGFLFARGDAPETVEASLRAAHACLQVVLIRGDGTT